MDELTKTSKPGSQLVLSGLLIEDQVDMIQLAKQNGWNFLHQKQMNGWISLLFSRL
jgi:ribosomal protein L11 methylase PrmA